MNSIDEIFGRVIKKRAWYKGTDINRFQANGLKRRFNSGELLDTTKIKVLLKLGYEIDIKDK